MCLLTILFIENRNFEFSYTSILRRNLREKPLLIQQPENAYAEAPFYTSFALPWVPIAQDPLNIPTAETENKPIGKDLMGSLKNSRIKFYNSKFLNLIKVAMTQDV